MGLSQVVTGTMTISDEGENEPQVALKADHCRGAFQRAQGGRPVGLPVRPPYRLVQSEGAALAECAREHSAHGDFRAHPARDAGAVERARVLADLMIMSEEGD